MPDLAVLCGVAMRNNVRRLQGIQWAQQPYRCPGAGSMDSTSMALLERGDPGAVGLLQGQPALLQACVWHSGDCQTTGLAAALARTNDKTERVNREIRVSVLIPDLNQFTPISFISQIASLASHTSLGWWYSPGCPAELLEAGSTEFLFDFEE